MFVKALSLPVLHYLEVLESPDKNCGVGIVFLGGFEDVRLGE